MLVNRTMQCNRNREIQDLSAAENICYFKISIDLQPLCAFRK